MSLQLAAAAYIYMHYAFRKRKTKKAAAVVANAIIHKQGSLQWSKFIKRLECWWIR